MNNITKALAYLFVIFLLLAIGGYIFNKQQTPQEEVKPTNNTPVVVENDSVFVNDIKTLYNEAKQQWTTDSSTGSMEITYCNVDGCINNITNASAAYIYYISFNSEGKINKFYVVDGTYQFSYSGDDLLIDNITNGRKISEIDPSEAITITPNM